MTALVTFFLEMLGVVHKSNMLQVYYQEMSNKTAKKGREIKAKIMTTTGF